MNGAVDQFKARRQPVGVPIIDLLDDKVFGLQSSDLTALSAGVEQGDLWRMRIEFGELEALQQLPLVIE